MIILTEQDIINTYNKRQQEQARLYQSYKKIKQENSEFGYKRIAKLLGQPEHKTRWWHAKKHTPVSIQTTEWLKSKDLLPLDPSNVKLPSISKILGTTFGDGGIFGNLNGIFLSSSERGAVEEFGEDLKTIFGREIEQNSRVIEGGEYGHSWCYQNTNRNIIRFFHALGAPIGKKSRIDLNIPEWLNHNQQAQDAFFSSLLGNEIGIPKIHRLGKGTNSFDIGLVCKKELKNSRLKFLRQIQKYLKTKGIKAESMYIRQHKEDKSSYIIKLAISLNFDNLISLHKNIKLSYASSKQEKLKLTMNQLSQLKLQRFKKLSNTLNKLTKKNYSREWIKHNLRLTDKSLNFILKQEPVEKWN